MATYPDLPAVLRHDLVAGERVLWSATPRAGYQATMFGIWLVAIPWTVFSLAWESMAMLPLLAAGSLPAVITWGFGIVMPLFGLPFIAVGLWMLYLPIRAMRRTRRTLYALTDRRAIRIVGGRATERTSVFLDRIGPVELSERGDGWGTIRIQTHSGIDSEGDRQTQRFDIAGVPDVATAHRLILEHQAVLR